MQAPEAGPREGFEEVGRGVGQGSKEVDWQRWMPLKCFRVLPRKWVVVRFYEVRRCNCALQRGVFNARHSSCNARTTPP